MQELNGNIRCTRFQLGLPESGTGTGNDDKNSAGVPVLDHPVGNKADATDLPKSIGRDEQMMLWRAFGQELSRKVRLIGMASVLPERFPNCLA